MTKSRTVLAATFALMLLGGGIAATGTAQAHRAVPAKPTGVPSLPPRTKNAALPTTTTPMTVTTPKPQLPRTKNAALSDTTLAPTAVPPKLNTAPSTTFGANTVTRPTTVVRPTTTSVVKTATTPVPTLPPKR